MRPRKKALVIVGLTTVAVLTIFSVSTIYSFNKGFDAGVIASGWSMHKAGITPLYLFTVVSNAYELKTQASFLAFGIDVEEEEEKTPSEEPTEEIEPENTEAGAGAGAEV